MTAQASPSARLLRTLLAVSFVTVLLAIGLAWPRRGLEPVRSTAVELDEPSETRRP